ncbi:MULTISPECIES: hypothetical protein [Vibrio]|uniref:Uncharacterized protein n=1 Tax=Vibrio proteolyticus NBRC 13287 TaxID=1219065 RepID=U3BCE5_VIBPR|nr:MULTISPECIES: hypothetical protein [Vibrio]NAW56587.1 hypothetical protein [Vibrio sp. V36_P2S2PM302]NAX26694.1 hypothetical protein [Vibrio sp. V38_P2S17PM301]NAX30936.1 hypothetical protein [Vibrio sp. V37_P2S8PM304]GAD67444.1 hypothetical protein VPR01S_08_00270 [Vibrio proteolyticus NBRC 13287]
MEFTITRITTHIGIFKLAGVLSGHNDEVTIHYSSVEFMGTDGWVAINSESTAGLSILKAIEGDVIRHLTH